MLCHQWWLSFVTTKMIPDKVLLSVNQFPHFLFMEPDATRKFLLMETVGLATGKSLQLVFFPMSTTLYLPFLDRPRDNHMAGTNHSGDNWKEVSLKIDDGEGNLHLPPPARAEGDEEQAATKCSSSSTGHEQRRLRLQDVLVSTAVVSSLRKSRRANGRAAQSRLMDPPPSSLRKKRTEEEDMEIDEDDLPEEYALKKCGALTIAEWVGLVLVVAALVCSRSIPGLRKKTLWDLALWKWEVMGVVVICGGLVSDWGVRLSVQLMERNFLLKKKVLYFVYGLRRVVRNCVWLFLVLIVWQCLFYQKVAVESEAGSKVLPYVTKILICLLISTLVWLVKIILVKVLASSFHMNTFFDEIQGLLIKQHVVKRLLTAKAENSGNGVVVGTAAGADEHSNKKKKKKKNDHDQESGEISIERLDRMSRRSVSAWSMKILVDKVHYGGLSTLDELILNLGIGDDECPSEDGSDCRATRAAEKIIRDINSRHPEYILLDDLVEYMGEVDAKKTMECIGGANCDRIHKGALKEWVVSAIKEGRKLAYSLNDTKTAVDDLHRMIDVFVVIILAIISLAVLGVPITHFLIFLSSQLLLVVFVFGNTCKTTFEAIIFLFVMHPYDVGDRCEIDGNQLVVEEMNILTTVFLRADNQLVRYPNSVLATKPVCNYKRSMDMVESIDFCIHISTPMKKITTFREKLKRYVEKEGEHWHPNPAILILEVEELNKLKMGVWLTHRMNGQNSGERWVRRSLLVEEMIRLFAELDIKYHMLPLHVNIISHAAAAIP